MTHARLAAISVDLDEIGCYHAIHGLSPDSSAPQNPIYDKAVLRLGEFFARHNISATFFAIGSDLARTENRERLAWLHQSGHEIANHSFSHRYDFSRQTREWIVNDVQQGMDAIAQVTGERPVGFRAPGYTINDKVISALVELDVKYDSSVFPCPWYYALKAAAIAWIKLRRRRSHSIIDSPHVLRAPADPYRMGRKYWQKGAGLVELPIGVTRALSLRLPYIGTSLTVAGPKGARWLTRMISGRAFVNLELHGIDLADAGQDGIAYLRPHQPDLRRPLSDKIASLEAVVQQLKEDGYQFVTLQKAHALLFT